MQLVNLCYVANCTVSIVQISLMQLENGVCNQLIHLQPFIQTFVRVRYVLRVGRVTKVIAWTRTGHWARRRGWQPEGCLRILLPVTSFPSAWFPVGRVVDSLVVRVEKPARVDLAVLSVPGWALRTDMARFEAQEAGARSVDALFALERVENREAHALAKQAGL